jgi:hypothetical protein
MKNRRIQTLLLLPLIVAIGIGMSGCDGAFNQSFKLISRTLPSLSKIISGVLCQDDPLELPAIMRFDFEGRMGWITFEERYQGRVLASYRMEMPNNKVSVPGEYGLVENPAAQIPIGNSIYGVMELTREGRSLQGFFEQTSDNTEKGELMLQFSRNMQSFTGKWRLEGDKGWSENLTGSAN